MPLAFKKPAAFTKKKEKPKKSSKIALAVLFAKLDEIVYVGWNAWGYGNVVVINHGEWQTLYAHLDSWNVSCGQSVYQGDVIGYMGSTGNSSGPHLHLEMQSDTYGLVDPTHLLP